MSFIIYNKEGKIVKTIETKDHKMAEAQVQEGEMIIRAEGKPNTHYVRGGKVVALTEKQLKEYRNPPTGHAWNWENLKNEQVVDDAELNEQLANKARTKRNELLKDTDWVMFTDSPLNAEQMLKYKEYRQALRDVPQQKGFPKKINWPTKSE